MQFSYACLKWTINTHEAVLLSGAQNKAYSLIFPREAWERQSYSPTIFCVHWLIFKYRRGTNSPIVSSISITTSYLWVSMIHTKMCQNPRQPFNRLGWLNTIFRLVSFIYIYTQLYSFIWTLKYKRGRRKNILAAETLKIIVLEMKGIPEIMGLKLSSHKTGNWIKRGQEKNSGSHQ